MQNNSQTKDFEKKMLGGKQNRTWRENKSTAQKLQESR